MQAAVDTPSTADEDLFALLRWLPIAARTKDMTSHSFSFALSDYREGGSSLSTYSPASPVFRTSQ